MKVEYPLQLFKSFNKRIWSNKVFSYFVIALIIGFTVLLKQVPEVYYKYMLNPVLLLISMMVIIIITIYNFQLGLILTISLITLYYPAKYYYNTNQLENFEGNILPIEKSDKNIVDDESQGQKIPQDNNEDSDEESTEEATENIDITETPIEENEDGENDESTNDQPEIEQDEKETFKPSKEKFSGIRLERLNPSYFKNTYNQNDNKPSNNNNKSNNKASNNKASNNKILKNSSSNIKEKLTDVKNPKNKKQDDEKTFLGEVRNIFKDLDTGKNKMKATTAIKKINDLMYNKHKTDIQKIINEDDDDDDDEEDISDDDYF